MWLMATLNVLLLAAVIVLLTHNVKLKQILFAGLRKAEADRADMVRIPYNQLAQVLGWRSELYPLAGPKDHTHTGSSRHPALLAPARRRKLARLEDR